jgi:hypothetical protein
MTGRILSIALTAFAADIPAAQLHPPLLRCGKPFLGALADQRLLLLGERGEQMIA